MVPGHGKGNIRKGLMELKHLKTFLYVSRCLNFTKAAEQLNYSQPAVTAQIQALEQELEQTFFFHVGRQTYLTPAGTLLQSYAEQVFAVIDDMRQAFSTLGRPYGSLSIAAYETFCSAYFPVILSEFVRQYPEVKIKLHSHVTNEVIRGVLANEYDMGIISGTFQHPELENVIVAEENLVLVVSEQTAEQYAGSNLLRDLPFLKYRVDGPFSDTMNRFLAKARPTPKSVIEFDSLEAIKQAAIRQLGVALISENLVKKEIETNTLRCIYKDEETKIMTSLIMLRDKAGWPTAKAFQDILLSKWQVL